MATLRMKPISLSPLESDLLRDYMDELTALIDADDGTLFNMKLIEKHEEILEIIK